MGVVHESEQKQKKPTDESVGLLSMGGVQDSESTYMLATIRYPFFFAFFASFFACLIRIVRARFTSSSESALVSMVRAVNSGYVAV